MSARRAVTTRAWRGKEPLTTDRAPAVRLTPRERQIVACLVDGKTNAEIAARLGVSPQTIKNQLSTLYRKTGTRGRLPLVVAMLRRAD
jgi:DNA-binding CsgD family transcriptional regulator